MGRNDRTTPQRNYKNKPGGCRAGGQVMCNCIMESEKELRKNYLNAKIKTGFTFPNIRIFPIIEVQYDKPGKKKKYIQNLIPAFCPFCGIKYEEV